MHKKNTVFQAWVKNVYNPIFIVSNLWKNSVFSSSHFHISNSMLRSPVYESTVLHQFIQELLAYFYTPRNVFSPQLNTSFTHFPQGLLLLQQKEKGEK